MMSKEKDQHAGKRGKRAQERSRKWKTVCDTQSHDMNTAVANSVCDSTSLSPSLSRNSSFHRFAPPLRPIIVLPHRSTRTTTTKPHPISTFSPRSACALHPHIDSARHNLPFLLLPTTGRLRQLISVVIEYIPSPSHPSLGYSVRHQTSSGTLALHWQSALWPTSRHTPATHPRTHTHTHTHMHGSTTRQVTLFSITTCAYHACISIDKLRKSAAGYCTLVYCTFIDPAKRRSKYRATIPHPSMRPIYLHIAQLHSSRSYARQSMKAAQYLDPHQLAFPYQQGPG